VVSSGELDFPARPINTDSMATVQITPEAEEQARRLPKEIRRRIMKMVERLESWPNVSGLKRLSGNLAGWYRLRTGDYRLRFRLQGDIAWWPITIARNIGDSI
jgi:mRNA-degrading endonuclease RelE of RelBE toxin-antitoxin system